MGVMNNKSNLPKIYLNFPNVWVTILNSTEHTLNSWNKLQILV